VRCRRAARIIDDGRFTPPFCRTLNPQRKTASPETTQIYLHADMAMKEKALARTTNLKTTPKRYRPDDRLLAYLESL
jgi:hypothetical protein